MSLELRRREMMQDVKETDLTGWTLGKGLTTGNYYTIDELLCVSPYYDVAGGEEIEVVVFNTFDSDHQCKLIGLDSNNKRNMSLTIDTKPQIVALESDTVRFRVVCTLAYIDNCYIKDLTNNVFLWKGKNVK